MTLRSAVRVGPLLAVAAVSGYLLSGCGGGLDGLTGFSGATELPSVALPEVTVPEVTVPEVTLPEVTLPDVTVPTLPEPETTTTESTTTAKPPITTEPPTTVVETKTEIETITMPTETAVAARTLAETTPAQPSSDDETPWGWLALAVGLLLAAGGVAVWALRRRRTNDL